MKTTSALLGCVVALLGACASEPTVKTRDLRVIGSNPPKDAFSATAYDRATVLAYATKRCAASNTVPYVDREGGATSQGTVGDGSPGANARVPNLGNAQGNYYAGTKYYSMEVWCVPSGELKLYESVKPAKR